MVEDQWIAEVTAAVNCRDRIASGAYAPEEVPVLIHRMIDDGFWSNAQIASIVGWRRQAVGKMARDAQRLSKPLRNGTLHAGALDVILLLQQQARAGTGTNDLLLSAAVSTGTSTKLISHLTGISLGKVLYQKRKLTNEGTA